jgi:hypothetical protein
MYSLKIILLLILYYQFRITLMGLCARFCSKWFDEIENIPHGIWRGTVSLFPASKFMSWEIGTLKCLLLIFAKLLASKLEHLCFEMKLLQKFLCFPTSMCRHRQIGGDWLMVYLISWMWNHMERRRWGKLTIPSRKEIVQACTSSNLENHQAEQLCELFVFLRDISCV